MYQRDAFSEENTKEEEKDKSIYFLSGDFGAAALDELRERFPNNFLHCGISDQAMLDIAAAPKSPLKKYILLSFSSSFVFSSLNASLWYI
jgi:transketolase C-terminal domain/subunit